MYERQPCTNSCDRSHTGQSRDWWYWTCIIIYQGCDVSGIRDLFWVLCLSSFLKNFITFMGHLIWFAQWFATSLKRTVLAKLLTFLKCFKTLLHYYWNCSILMRFDTIDKHKLVHNWEVEGKLFRFLKNIFLQKQS